MGKRKIASHVIIKKTPKKKLNYHQPTYLILMQQLKKNAMAWLRQVKMTALLRPHHVQALRMLMGTKSAKLVILLIIPTYAKVSIFLKNDPIIIL
jgi:hypothetical protein